MQILSMEELSEGKLDKPVLKSECGPLLLAIKENNLTVLKDMIREDNAINLRESLRGPVE